MQGYRVAEDALQVIRGRIRIGDQITRRPGVQLPVEVTYDDFTTDIPENQILRTALRRLLVVPRLPEGPRARLAHLDARLAGVEIARPGTLPPTWVPTRLNRLYQPALRLADLVVRNMSAEARTGGVQVAAFVVPMWQVFEDFVTTALREALRAFPGRTQTDPQYSSHLDNQAAGQRGAITIALDAVHLVHGIPHMIFDAKYKAASPRGRYPNADHYQMLAYCTALAVPTGWLAYAQGGVSPVVRQIRNTQISIIEYPLDLRVLPRDILRQIDQLAKRAWDRTGLPSNRS